MIPKLYTQYRDPDAVQAMNPHLHNVPLQIAAERGLPALAIWLAFIAVLAYSLFRIFRSERRSDVLPRPASPPSPACSPPVSSSTTSATPSS